MREDGLRFKCHCFFLYVWVWQKWKTAKCSSVMHQWAWFNCAQYCVFEVMSHKVPYILYKYCLYFLIAYNCLYRNWNGFEDCLSVPFSFTTCWSWLRDQTTIEWHISSVYSVSQLCRNLTFEYRDVNGIEIFLGALIVGIWWTMEWGPQIILLFYISCMNLIWRITIWQ